MDKPNPQHDGPTKLGDLLADDVRTKTPLVPGAVAVLTELLTQVQHDGDRQAMVLVGQLDQRLGGLGLDVGGVDDRANIDDPAD